MVTGADINYVGSISIDEDLLERTGIEPYEKVAVWNVTNGNRVETYALPAKRGAGQIILNGAAARKFAVGDLVIIAAFVVTDEIIKPRMIAVDETNRFTGWLADNRPGARRSKQPLRLTGEPD